MFYNSHISYKVIKAKVKSCRLHVTGCRFGACQKQENDMRPYGRIWGMTDSYFMEV